MLHKKGQNGFSLIELIVVMAVFSTVLLVISDIFVNVMRTQHRTLAWQQVQSDLRYTMDVLAQEIRMGQIEYEYAGYPAELNLPEDELALINDSGQEVVYKVFDSDCPAVGIHCLKRKEGAGEFKSLTGNKFDITRLDFYILDKKDPYKYDQVEQKYLTSSQPFVVVVIEGHSVGVTELDQKQLSLQTAVVTRYYER